MEGAAQEWPDTSGGTGPDNHVLLCEQRLTHVTLDAEGADHKRPTAWASARTQHAIEARRLRSFGSVAWAQHARHRLEPCLLAFAAPHNREQAELHWSSWSQPPSRRSAPGKASTSLSARPPRR